MYENHVYAMMQRLGVSETEEVWSNPFWGGTTSLPPPPPSPPPPPPQPQPQPPQPPAAQPSTQPTPSSEELHDCEANGNGKRGKKPMKKSMPKKPSTQKRKPAHPKKNPKNSAKKKTATIKKKTQEKKKPKAKSIRALAKGKSMGKPISLLGLIA